MAAFCVGEVFLTKTCQGGPAPKRLLAVPKPNPLEIPGAGGQDDAHVGQVGNQVVEQLSVGDLGDHVADERKLFVDAVHLGERIFEHQRKNLENSHPGRLVDPGVDSIGLLARWQPSEYHIANC